MGTSKHLVILLVIALGGILAAGQDQPAASAPPSQSKASNTRFASCIVRITVDPAIMPLNLENIESLLQSSGVAVKAAREVLGLTEMQVFNIPLLKVGWLNAASAPMPAGARASRPAEMEEIYGRDYMRQMMGSSGEEKKDGAQTQAAQLAASPQDRPETTTQRLPGESDVAYRVRLNQMRVKVQQETKARGMQGTGGMGGMGVAGMGGYGGGMAGRMGGYGSMGSYGAPGSAQQGERMEQSATIKLIAEMPGEAPPRAEEFLGAVVTNLRESLRQAHESCRSEIEQMLVDAKTQYQFVESRLDSTTREISPATMEIRKQLDMYVDLSALNRQTPLEKAIEVLSRSVDPPLNIVVLWRDIQTNLSVEPTSPINIDGSPRIRLRTALDLLAKGLYNYNGSATAIWRIRDDSIVIGTAATLDPSQGAAGQSQVEADAVNLAGQRSELARRVQALELDLAGIDARQKAIQDQIAVTQAAAVKQLARDPVTQELEQLEHTSAINLANLKKAADAKQISASELARAQESAARTRIDLARRREELSRQAGGGQLEEFTKDLSHSAVDKAEKEAQLKIVRRQLDEVQKQLVQALTFDPEAARLRMAQESLDITARRIAELQMRIVNLQAPTVLMLGAN